MHETLDQIERDIIEKVKELRKEKGISQTQLSLAIGKGTTFISDIEAPSKKAKYNIIHLNLIAIALSCSPRDFWPNDPITEKKYTFINSLNKKSSK